MNETITEIETKRIAVNPNNPRSRIEDVSDLTSSIKASGLLQPIIVRWTHKRDEDGLPTGYEVVAGSRRLTACKELKMAKVPCIIRNVTDSEAFELATMENVVRENMTAVDEANAVSKLYAEGRSRYEIAAIFGKSVRWAEGRRKIVSLGDKAMEALAAGTINLGHAEILTMCAPDRVEYFLGQAKWHKPAELKTMILQDRKRLDKAPFNVAKICAKCENKSDNQQDLFGDVKDSYCLNESCYKKQITAEVARIIKNYTAQGWLEVPEDEQHEARFAWTDEYIEASTEDESERDAINNLKAKGVKPRYWIDRDTAETALVFRVADDPDATQTEISEDEEDNGDSWQLKKEIRERANKLEEKAVNEVVAAIITGMTTEQVAFFLDRCTDVKYKFTESTADGETKEREESPLLHLGEPVVNEDGFQQAQRHVLPDQLTKSIVAYYGVPDELRQFYTLEPRETIEARVRDEILEERKQLENDAEAATKEE